MQDRPTAKELLDAVAGFLFSEVASWVPPERRFQVLVAANVCAVVGRELEMGEELDRADAEHLGSLEELARRLRSGDLDDRLDEVAADLREHVRRKLRIARPGYDGEP
jgi:Domain of unknown function (DUF6285)